MFRILFISDIEITRRRNASWILLRLHRVEVPRPTLAKEGPRQPPQRQAGARRSFSTPAIRTRHVALVASGGVFSPSQMGAVPIANPLYSYLIPEYQVVKHTHLIADSFLELL